MRVQAAVFGVVVAMAAGADQKIKQLYEFGPFRVDPDKELLLRNDQTVALAPKAFQILLVLIRHSKEIVTKDDLMKNVCARYVCRRGQPQPERFPAT
jgi:DNA-binding response OmpR family regulator